MTKRTKNTIKAEIAALRAELESTIDKVELSTASITFSESLFLGQFLATEFKSFAAVQALINTAALQGETPGYAKTDISLDWADGSSMRITMEVEHGGDNRVEGLAIRCLIDGSGFEGYSEERRNECEWKLENLKFED